MSRCHRADRPGIRVHRSATLTPADIELVDAIPTTTTARTLLDLAEVLDSQSLAKAFHGADELRLLDLRELHEVIARNPGRHGLHRLQALLTSSDPHDRRTRNDFEAGFLALCGTHGLPTPRVNDWLELEGTWIEADFHWPAHRLVAETDGWETHGTRHAFESDRRRDQLLLRAGYRTVRFTWRQVRDDPGWVVQTVRHALAASWPPPARRAAAGPEA